MKYELYNGGKKIESVYAGGKDISRIYKGDRLIWEKSSAYGEFSFEWEDIFAVKVLGKCEIDTGTGIIYHSTGETKYIKEEFEIESEGTHTAIIKGNLRDIVFYIRRYDGPTVSYSKDTVITKVLTAFPATMKEVTKIVTGFHGQKKLSIIPTDLFEHLTNLTDAGLLFSGCKSLTSIPEDLFKNNEKIESFLFAFGDSGIENIPANLFQSCVNAKNFAYCFSNTPIASIPEGLFRNNKLAENFSYCFFSCDNLQIVPDYLFAGLNHAVDFSGCLYGVRESASLPVVPQRTLPAHLFQGCTAAVTFESCFAFYNTPVVPSGLFDDCVNAEDFTECFYSCKHIIVIAPDVFDNCVKANNFTECFETSYVIGTLTPDTELIEAPRLWEKFPNATGTECYRLQKKLSFYSEIPSDWK